MKRWIAAALLLGAAGRAEDRTMTTSALGAPPIDREAPPGLETATFALG